MIRFTRIEKERNEFMNWKNTFSCEGNPNPKFGDNIWNVIMDGPSDSPYMGGKFRISIEFPPGYPSECPIFKFLTPICHININKEHICLSSLNYYEPNTSISDILCQIFMMLTSPNEDSPYNTYIDLYNNHHEEYLRKAREMTKQYAMNNLIKK